MEKTINEIRPFEFEGQELKTIMIENIAWFVGKEVATILGYKNQSDGLKKHVDDEDKQTIAFRDSLSRNPNKVMINESGLYSLILSSKLESARKFKHWVTSVVLPEIRKTGSFNPINKLDSYMIEDPVERATAWIEEKKQMLALESSNKEMKPKADFVDAIETSCDVISINQLSKLLSNNIKNIGQNRLFKWLRDNKYLSKRKGVDWNLPTQRSINLGVMQVQETHSYDHYGEARINKTTKITAKGQRYFVKKFLSEQEMQLTE